jgi:hypothetical protein
MSGRDPKPKSPERLDLLRVDSAGYVDGSVEVTVTYRYDSWCCNGFHEVADGVQAVHQMVDKAVGRAYKKRTDRINAEYREIREDLGI